MNALFVKARAFLLRWQEHALLLPLLVGLALGAWVVLGALDRTATVDVLALLIALPIKTGYAVAALALTYLVRRRWRRRLTDDEQKALWDRLMAGERGPLSIYLADAVVTLCALFLLLRFFSLRS